MTIYQTALLIKKYYWMRLNFFEKTLLDKLIDGISGLGYPKDDEIKEYLTTKQMQFIKRLGKRFLIT